MFWNNKKKEAHQLQLQLNEQEWFIQGIKNCVDGIWTFSDGLVQTSTKLLQKLGYTFFQPEMTSPRWWLHQIHPDDRIKAENFFSNNLAGKEHVSKEIELRARHAQGHFVWLIVHCDARRMTKDSPIRLMGTISDISFYRLLHTQLERTLKEAEQSSQTKSKFIALLNHELRTPIGGIISMTNMLSETSLDSRQRGFLDHILSSSELLLTLVNDILDVERISAGKLAIESHTFNLVQVIQRTIHIVEPLAEKKNLPLHVQIDPKIPEYVIGDSTRLQQILMNFLSNAIKFTKKGTVTLSAQLKSKDTFRDKLEILFKVTDTGMGISSEQAAHLFSDFTQANATISRTHGGSGLGLSICKKLVSLMEGEIGVQSAEGKGSVFWFSLPYKLADREDLGEYICPIHHKLKILLAEDNLINQEVMQGYLSKLGDEMVIANNGLEAIELFESDPSFDLIFMDINMPGMDGIAAMERIRQTKKGKTIPIIAITANSFSEQWKEYLDKGMTAVLVKPVALSKLEDLLLPYRHQARNAFQTATKQPPSRPKDLSSKDELEKKSNPAMIVKLPITDLGLEKTHKLLDLYHQEATQIVNHMNTADGKDLHNLAHTLAGMSENLGLMTVGKTAREIMEKATSSSDMSPLVSDLHHQLDTSVKEAQKILGRHSS